MERTQLKTTQLGTSRLEFVDDDIATLEGKR
jgi:hypothetical protein